MAQRPRALKPGLDFRDRVIRVWDSLLSYQKRPKKFLARTEYWVYLPGTELPAQEAIMDRMLNANPYSVRGVSPIGSREAILFSDIRTHIALVLKSRNQQIFRPSVLPDLSRTTPEELEILQGANSLVKVSYLSEEPLANTYHLGFLAHAADAIADLGQSGVIYDRVAEHLWSRAELEQELRRDPSARSGGFHVRVNWVVNSEGGHVETRGLRKLGIAEIKTVAMQQDERVLIHAVIELAVEEIFQANAMPPEISVTLFDDEFKVVQSKQTPEFNFVRVLRVGGG